MDDPIAEISKSLVEAIERAIGPWIEHAVSRRSDRVLSNSETIELNRVIEEGRADITGRLSELLAADIDEQRTTPLAILRSAYRWPTVMLKSMDVPEIRRDPFDVRQIPDDVYGLSPQSWADFGEEVGDLGIMWGAAKAHVHLQRHRAPDS